MDKENNISFQISFINDKSYEIKSFEDFKNFTSRNIKSKENSVLDFNNSENNETICKAFIYFSNEKEIEDCLKKFTKNYVNNGIEKNDNKTHKESINNSFKQLLKDNKLEIQEIDLFDKNDEQVIRQLKGIRLMSIDHEDIEKKQV